MSTSSPDDAAATVMLLNLELRNVVAQSVLFQQAIAERLGLNLSDLNILDALARIGPMSAGQLGAENGLTTGGITFAVDRLEKAGFVSRSRDAQDRRRVIINAMPGVVERVAPLFSSLSRSITDLCAGYSGEELALILDFMQKAAPITHTEMLELRAGAQDRSR